ncbi:hypothetical protein [uncultured Roseobacter sp.]|uniref:hypothetical protein n=1 Tax=uncultured Roseobacter sp. TaxID=114847 RepID=UPI0026366257|nr:hypothetical protein [uncultured Roseobacter sp.]
MTLTLDQRTQLMLAYEPRLVMFERDAAMPPLSFETFLSESGLWSSIALPSQFSTDDRRLKWGLPKTAATFPRTVDVAAGEFDFDPGTFTDNFRIGIGDNNALIPSKFFFLSTGAWDPDGTPQLPGVLDEGVISQNTPVISANFPALRARFGTTANNSDAIVPDVGPALHRYSAEVLEFKEAFLGVDGEIFFSNNLSDLGFNPVLIFYYYLFPTHEELLSSAEAAATLATTRMDDGVTTIDEIIEDYLEFLKDVLPQQDPVEVPPGGSIDISQTEGPVYGQMTKSYAGDMQCVCVAVPTLAQTADGARILPEESDLPQPVVVGFGRRLRSLRDEIDLGHGLTSRSQQQIIATKQFESVGRRPTVYVAAGTHNFYASSGENGIWPLNVNERGFPIPTVSPEDVPEQNFDDRRDWAVLTSLLKFATMDPFSALFSSIQESGAEGFDSSGTGTSDAQPGSETVDVVPVAPDAQGTVVIKTRDAPEPAEGVRFWRQGIDASDLPAVERSDVVQANQAWWPHRPDVVEAASLGYAGRWGVECVNDPFDARSGERFPDFQWAMLSGLNQILA